MKAADIQVGQWYETTLGVGKCLSKDKNRVEVTIVRPVPRGRIYLAPRQVTKQVSNPTVLNPY
jgi:hypothetical protein